MVPVVIGVAHNEIIFHPDNILLFDDAGGHHGIFKVTPGTARVPDVESGLFRGVLHVVSESGNQERVQKAVAGKGVVHDPVVKPAADTDIGHAIRRVGVHELRLFSLHEPLHGGLVGGIATDQAVSPQVPDVPGLGDGGPLLRLGGISFVILYILGNPAGLFQRGDDVGDVLVGEAGQLHGHIVSDLLDQIHQTLVVDGGELRQAVIRNQVGPFLGLGGILLKIGRYLLPAFALRRQQAAVALGDETAALADSDGLPPAGGLNDVAQHIGLLLGVLVRVPGVRYRLLDGDQRIVGAEHRNAVSSNGPRLRLGAVVQPCRRLLWFAFCHLFSPP